MAGTAITAAAVAEIAAAAPSKKPAPQAFDEIDAISEADLFLNYGRDQQAEDLLKEALAKTPGNIPIQLKLLSIYANRKDVNKFTTIARQLKDSGDEAAWQQTCALGHTVDPGNPMYGEPGTVQPAAAAAAPEPAAPAVKPLDIDVGFNIPMDLDVTSAAPAAPAAAGTMDFDVSAYTAMPAMDLDVTGAHEPAEQLLPDFDVTGGHPLTPVTGMDMDVTGGHPEAVESAGMDFDVTGSHPNVVGASSMDFDVTGSHPNVVGTTSMDFDVTGSHVPVAAELPAESSMSTVVLDTGLDFGASAAAIAATGGMDFDLGTAPVSAAPSAAPEAAGGMDFDLSAAPAAPAVAPADHDKTFVELSSGMDFDITGGEGAAQTEAAGTGMSSVVMNEPMDFNIAAAPAEASAGLGGLDFNITGEKPAAAAATAETPAALGGLDFNITGDKPTPGVEETQDIKSTVVLSAPMDLDVSAPSPAADTGLNFDLSSAPSVVLPAGSSSEAAALGGGMDFDISAPQGAKTEPPLDLSGISLDVSAGAGASVADTVVFPAAETKKDDRWQDVQNKLELATAFLEGMGDADTARELLGEVLNEGDAQQVETARTLIQKI